MDPPSSSTTTPKPTWTLPIYESTPHYPPTTTTFPSFPSSSSTDDRPPFSHGKEHMFDKVVTPSDVGKLNRLVIPKQHAEKHFPLDSNSSDKGLLLDFEDRTGKSWRFRYSYWNSSQSYVMTKGWSRFVKEKKLDAGDVVSFQRGVDHKFYIDWRRRPDAPPPHPPPPQSHHQIHFQHGGGVFYPHRGPLPPPPPPPLMFQQHQRRRESHLYGYNYGVVGPNFGSVVYMRAPRSSVSEPAVVFDSVPVVQGGGNGAAAAKRLRLFGVNMDCTVTESANVATNSSEAGGSLELRLDGRGLASDSSMSTTTTTTTTTATTSDSTRAIEFLEKGKSSMSLDFDI